MCQRLLAEHKRDTILPLKNSPDKEEGQMHLALVCKEVMDAYVTLSDKIPSGVCLGEAFLCVSLWVCMGGGIFLYVTERACVWV